MSLRDELLRLFPRLRDVDGWVVGGAVRDLHLGVPPADVDVACRDPFAEAQKIRRNPIRLGKEEHLSAWRAVDGEDVYDFAELLDGDIGVDLARRDFTINAMAVSLADGALLDPHRGRDDLAARIVRMVDPANFDDDPLRVLKGVRMAVKLGFEIEPETLAAMRARAPRIAEMAQERITSELSAIFSAGAFRKAVALLFGPSREFHADDVSLAGAVALLPDLPPAKWSEAFLREVATLRRLIEHHDRMALYDAGESIARQLPAVLRALGRNDILDWPDFTIRPLLTGEEIAEITGVPPGPELGRIKRALVEAQVWGRVQTHEDAVAFLVSSRA